MSELTIVDTHQHLWDTRVLSYPEFAGDPGLDRPFLAADYTAAARACGISASIAVEAASAGAPGDDETRWLLAEAGSSQLISGVVAWAPVGEPRLAQYLRGLKARYGPAIVGIRRGFEADRPAVLGDPAVTAGIRQVGAAGLPFDLLLSASQLPAAARVVDLCPGTRFVLNHLGNPPAGRGALASWQTDLGRLADSGRVACKLSGITVRPYPVAAAARAAITAKLRLAVRLFGADRVMFGSDWPVSTGGGPDGLAGWLAVVQAALVSLTAAELASVLGGTARRVYGLAAAPATANGDRRERT